MITDPKLDVVIFNAMKPVVNEKPLVVVCAWCPDARARTAAAAASGHDVTHGICAPCAKKLEEDSPK